MPTERSLNIPVGLELALSALSGVLLTASMPGFDVPFVGWVALVPLLVVLLRGGVHRAFRLALPFGLVLSIGVHNWYPSIFPPALGYFLIIAVGFYYAGLLHLGIWLYTRLPAGLKLLSVPVAWAAVEFLKFIAPVVRDWWFVLLAKSAWRFPAALQVLSVTGFPGLSFLLMLTNMALALLVLAALKAGVSPAEKWSSVAALGIVAAVLLWGAWVLPKAPRNTFTIAVLTDMVDQDPHLRGVDTFDGTRPNPTELSQAIFNIDAALTRQVAAQHPAFVVWSENEFADADDARFIGPLERLATEVHSYIVSDVVWHTQAGMYDTALMVSPEGQEVGRRAKINITAGERAAGFAPGPEAYPVFATPYGQVGLAVCWDRHRLYIVRELARHGAQIVLMPVDDDFDGNPRFPPFHASDGVFRAVENHVSVGLGTTNGLSLVVDPFGRITAQGSINARGVNVGATFVTTGQTLYTRWGDWFGWTLVLLLIGLIALAAKTPRIASIS